MFDRYGRDVLATARQPKPPKSKPIPATPGLVVEDPSTGFVGAVRRCYVAGGMSLVELEDRYGNCRAFPLGPGFWVDGKPVDLQRPKQKPHVQLNGGARASVVTNRKLTNSGSRAVPMPKQARVARASRLWVEGKHDAELVEYVWGDDLRLAGVVVELLDGVDNLPQVLADFQPSTTVRAGILVDHLVANSKESRLATQVTATYGSDAVLVQGHPFVDIWQAIKPQRVGLSAWPVIPRSVDIKVGTLEHLGWPNQTQADIATGWKKILHQVRNWRDLEPGLLGPVEALIDFVTAPHSD